MQITGRIYNSKTGQGVPYANIMIVDAGGVYQGIRTSADSGGYFTLNSPNLTEGDFMTITSAEYQSAITQVYYFTLRSDFPLDANITALPEIVIKPTTQSAAGIDWLPIAAIGVGLFFLVANKKRR